MSKENKNNPQNTEKRSPPSPYGSEPGQSLDGVPPTFPGDNPLRPELRKSSGDKVNPRPGVDTQSK